jgi:hypothetical protein
VPDIEHGTAAIRKANLLSSVRNFRFFRQLSSLAGAGRSGCGERRPAPPIAGLLWRRSAPLPIGNPCDFPVAK